MSRTALVTVEFTFEASHQLRRAEWSDGQNQAVFGDCARLHGHSYRLLVTLRGPIDGETGMVVNFRDLKRAVKERVIAPLDHHHLNELMGELSTAENLCYWIAQRLVPEFGTLLHRLELWETRSAYAALTEIELAPLLPRSLA